MNPPLQLLEVRIDALAFFPVHRMQGAPFPARRAQDSLRRLHVRLAPIHAIDIGFKLGADALAPLQVLLADFGLLRKVGAAWRKRTFRGLVELGAQGALLAVGGRPQGVPIAAQRLDAVGLVLRAGGRIRQRIHGLHELLALGGGGEDLPTAQLADPGGQLGQRLPVRCAKGFGQRLLQPVRPVQGGGGRLQAALRNAGLGLGDGALQLFGKQFLMLLHRQFGTFQGGDRIERLLHGRRLLRPLGPIQAGELTLQAPLGSGRRPLLPPKALQGVRLLGPIARWRRWRHGGDVQVKPALVGVGQLLVLMAHPLEDGVLGGVGLRLVGLGEPLFGEGVPLALQFGEGCAGPHFCSELIKGGRQLPKTGPRRRAVRAGLPLVVRGGQPQGQIRRL